MGAVALADATVGVGAVALADSALAATLADSAAVVIRCRGGGGGADHGLHTSGGV